MRVGLNCLYLIPGVVGGTETYARELVRSLVNVFGPDHFSLFVNREASDPAGWPPGVELVPCPIDGHRRAARYWFEQVRLPALCKHHHIDVLHSLGYVGPLRPPCPHVVSVHDVNFRHKEVAMSRVRRTVLGWFCEHSSRSADAVITGTEFARSEIVHRLHLDPARVQSVLYGPGQKTTPPPAARAIANPYVLTLTGGGWAHKNTTLVIDAFARIHDHIPQRLAVIGATSNAIQASIQRARAAGARITESPRATRGELSGLLASADVFVTASLYEGFGLPVLEAQEARVPVVSSTAASLPEVAGKGAVYFDPRCSIAASTALLQVCTSTAERARLTQFGTANLARFSWETTARGTYRIYQQLAGVRPRNRGIPCQLP